MDEEEIDRACRGMTTAEAIEFRKKMREMNRILEEEQALLEEQEQRIVSPSRPRLRRVRGRARGGIHLPGLLARVRVRYADP
jgi:LDH2 family malate/lactate/ureidoglycolate dehydrogenase